MNSKIFIILSFVLTPCFVFAAIPTKPETISDIFAMFAIGNMEGLIPSFILIALVTFLAGVVKYVGAGDNEEKRQAGRQVMIYGIITLFVMMSLWGFVKILTHTFFAEDKGIPNYLPPLLH